MAILLGVGAAFAAIMGTLVARQVADLVDALPGYSHQVADYLETELGVDISSQDVARTAGRTSDLVGSLVGGAFGLGATVLGVLFQVLTVATLTFFFAKDGPLLRRSVCSCCPPAAGGGAAGVGDRHRPDCRLRLLPQCAGPDLGRGPCHRAHGAGRSVRRDAGHLGRVGLPVHPHDRDLPGRDPSRRRGARRVPRTALLTLAFIVIYQQVENYILSPPLSAHTMRIHPALGLVAAIAGVALVGPIGALLALYVVATAQSVVSVYLTRHELVSNELVDETDEDGRVDGRVDGGAA